MKKHKAATGQFVNLTSLVDVVSMNVGILVILAVFMALLAVFSSSQDPSGGAGGKAGAAGSEGQARVTEPPTVRINVPWTHPTPKQTLFFVMRDNRIQYVDFSAIYSAMLRLPAGTSGGPIPLSVPGMAVRFYPVTSQVYCLDFVPHAGSGETWGQARRANSTYRAALSRYSREQFVYFFWVSGDSFELFRDVRKSLTDAQVEVGWKPVLRSAPLELCNGFEGSNTFQPQ
jgi:hypothetical protein